MSKQNNVQEKEQALNTIIKLAQDHNLTIEDISARLVKNAAHTDKGRAGLVITLLGYLGGLFIFSGLVASIGMIWDDLGSAMRVIVTFGPGLAALACGLGVLNQPHLAKAATPLFLIAAFLQPAGLFVFLDEYAGGDDALLGAMGVFGLMAVQMGLLFFKMRRTSLLFFALFFAFSFFWATMEKIAIDSDVTVFVMGLSGLLITHALNKTPHRAFTPFAYFVFALMMAGGAFALLRDMPPLDFLLIGLAGFMIYASVIAQSRTFLAASVIAMIGYLGYYTDHYFADMIGWPLALMGMGGILIALAAHAVKLGRKIKNPRVAIDETAPG